MFADLTRIGLRPTLAGLAVLIIGAIAGWGIGGQATFPPVRVIRFWVEGVIVRILRHPRWIVRALAIFVNNALICALVVTAGGVPAGAWISVALVGLSMGIAIRILLAMSLLHETDEPSPHGDDAPRAEFDAWALVGVCLNLVEVPAIAATLGLSLGQMAAPNGLALPDIWRIFGAWVAPALLIAAAGESLWIGRQRPFASHP